MTDGHRSVFAGIDIGGTKIATVLVDSDGTVIDRASDRAPAREGGAAMLDIATDLVRSMLARSSKFELMAAGVGAAGVVDHVDGRIRVASASFQGWAGYPVVDGLSERLGVPITLENDVNAFVVGEHRFGSVRGNDALGIMLGTGVGGALIVGGALRRGPHGAAGEIGHIPGYGMRLCTCGRRGHLETVASGTAIAQRYRERSTKLVAGAAEVAERARDGDVEARAVFEEAGSAVALAAVTAASLLDLGEVVVGGGVAHSWDLLAPAIDRTLSDNAPVSGASLRIVCGVLDDDAVAVGAAALAADIAERILH